MREKESLFLVEGGVKKEEEEPRAQARERFIWRFRACAEGEGLPTAYPLEGDKPWTTGPGPRRGPGFLKPLTGASIV